MQEVDDAAKEDEEEQPKGQGANKAGEGEDQEEETQPKGTTSAPEKVCVYT